jgi:hypothetical protein
MRAEFQFCNMERILEVDGGSSLQQCEYATEPCILNDKDGGS